MIQTIDAEEQIVKRVVESGTGGIVYAPRKWLGQEVIVILPKQPGDIKERLIGILGPKLEHVIGIYLTGSYARNESAKDSDIDILVISDSKFELPRRGNLDFTVVELGSMIESIKENPIQYLPMLLEAKPIINGQLLEQLKAIKMDLKKLNWFVETTKSSLKAVESLIESDRAENLEFSENSGGIYSLILRLRGMYIIECLLHKKRHSNSGFKDWMGKKGIDEKLLDKFYQIYKAERDNKKINAVVLLDDIVRFYKAAKTQLEMLEALLNARLKEKAEKGN